mmetsp:Transcript_6881/g.14926  ORF Transcript_6881/g.14926 Transcript_6881/m.14926 type:complete len:797 (-) Transcript_6881:100-2490(-)
MYVKVDQENAAKQSRSTIVIAISAQQFLLSMQMLSVVGQNSVRWHEPIHSLFKIVRLLVVDVDMVNINCVGNFSPVSKYFGRLFLIVVALALVVVYHFVFVIILHKCRFKARMRSLLGVMGTVLMMFYISILGTILLSLQCEDHPSGDWTLSAYPTVFCWSGDSNHTTMVIVACFALVFPLGFLIKCAHVVYVAPQRVLSLDVKFMLTYNFLFFRFTHEARWYSIYFLARNALVACAPIITSLPWQIMVLQGLMLSSLLVTTFFKPWRVMMANLIDGMTSVAMILLLTLTAFQAEDGDGDFFAVLATVGLVVLFLCIITAVANGIYNRILSMRKQFQFFLCHHKAHAGAMARLLKIQLSTYHLRGKVFVDSDDLAHLDTLFDYVRCHTEILTVLCTPEILQRPWCVGEITTANINAVKTMPVHYAQYQQPSEAWLQKVEKHVDLSCLTENGLTIDAARTALDVFRTLSPTLRMPTFMNNHSLQRLCREIMSGKAEDVPLATGVTKGNSIAVDDAGSKVFMGVDEKNLEGIAAARILSKLVTVHCHQTPELMPILLVDLEPDDGIRHLPPDGRTYVIVCTESCFTKGQFLMNLHEAMFHRLWSIPTVAGEGFRFPTPAFYEELRVTSARALAEYAVEDADSEALVEYVGMVFKAIAIVFTPNGSITILKTQALEMFKKIYDIMAGVTEEGTVVAMPSLRKSSENIKRGSDRKKSGRKSGDSKTGGPGGTDSAEGHSETGSLVYDSEADVNSSPRPSATAGNGTGAAKDDIDVGSLHLIKGLEVVHTGQADELFAIMI